MYKLFILKVLNVILPLPGGLGLNCLLHRPACTDPGDNAGENYNCSEAVAAVSLKQRLIVSILSKLGARVADPD